MSNTSKIDELININSGSTQENNEASPLSNIIFFILLTLIYCIVSIFYLFTGKSIENLKNNSNNKILLLIYISFLLAGNFYLNLKTAKTICPNTDLYSLYSQILLITIAPWLIIFVILYLILELFNGWIKPFSNTIGYFVVSFLGVRTTIKKLLSSTTDQSIDLKTVFKYIDNHNEKFVNEFSTDLVDYGEFIRQLKNDNIFKTDDKNDEHIQQLYKLLCIKNIVGRIVWYILAGLLICSITYNYIINIKCVTSSSVNKTKIDNMYNK